MAAYNSEEINGMIIGISAPVAVREIPISLTEFLAGMRTGSRHLAYPHVDGSAIDCPGCMTIV